MKKIFQKPEVKTLSVESVTIIAASTGGGEFNNGGGGDPGQAHARDLNTGTDIPSHGEGISAMELN